MTWVLCEIRDPDSIPIEPNWDRVPESRREHVRQRYHAAYADTQVQSWWLWDKQIETHYRDVFVRRLPFFHD